MWTYSQGTGKLTDKDGKHIATGYSGKGQGKNNCDMQHVKGVGPVVRGLFTIGKPRDSKKVGPFAMDLIPHPENEMFGRSAFMIHGDNLDGTASEGCIVVPRRVRHIIWDSGDRVLLVVP
jgi:hypothetical protein